MSKKKKLKITYNELGEAIKYERVFISGWMGFEVIFRSEKLDGEWLSHMILPPTGQNPVKLTLTKNEDEDDGYFSTNELRALLDSCYDFHRDILALDHLEVSVEINQEKT